MVKNTIKFSIPLFLMFPSLVVAQSVEGMPKQALVTKDLQQAQQKVTDSSKYQADPHFNSIEEGNRLSSKQLLKKTLSAQSLQSVKVDAKILLSHPKLLKRAMLSVVVTKQIAGIQAILPIYQQIKDKDLGLELYAKGLLAYSEGNYKQAIDFYRQLISLHPEYSNARLDLAMALYADHQFKAAKHQFLLLQSESLPANIANNIQRALEHISHQDNWRFNVNFYYLQDNNINNAPKKSEIKFANGTLILPKAEKAHGYHLGLTASKRVNFFNHFYSKLNLAGNGDMYWDNHAYDDVNLRIGNGFGYQNSTLQIEIEPFFKKRIYGTKSYSHTAGANGFIHYQLTPQWRLSQNWEWSYEHFNVRKFLNGQRRYLGLSALYVRNTRQYFNAGINYYVNKAQDEDEIYQRPGLYIGWGQEWPKGFSSYAQISMAKRHYKEQDYFGIKRKDKEYSGYLALWNRAWHWKGITPRLIFKWNKTQSNHFLYEKENSKINIEFSKVF